MPSYSELELASQHFTQSYPPIRRILQYFQDKIERGFSQSLKDSIQLYCIYDLSMSDLPHGAASLPSNPNRTFRRPIILWPFPHLPHHICTNGAKASERY
jgi:hypothetical protein